MTQFPINVIHISPNDIATLLSAFGKKDHEGEVQQREEEGWEGDEEEEEEEELPPETRAMLEAHEARRVTFLRNAAEERAAARERRRERRRQAYLEIMATIESIVDDLTEWDMRFILARNEEE